MRLQSFGVQGVRNLQPFSILPHPEINLIVGNNGSGKTSILEAIHILGMGRSFRTRDFSKVINEQQSECIITATLLSVDSRKTKIGIKKSKTNTLAKVNQQAISRISELADFLPIQVIAPESKNIVDSSRLVSRQFLDWGVFHVEHSFAKTWREYDRALAQRNKYLKDIKSRRTKGINKADESVLTAIENTMYNYAQTIEMLREKYWVTFHPFLDELREQFEDIPDVEFKYHRGWKGDFKEALREDRASDVDRGFTHLGAHKSYVGISSKRKSAKEILSRGQKKLFHYIWVIAQSMNLKQQKGKDTVFLFDDLMSELDKGNLRKILSFVRDTSHQVFITGINDHEYSVLLRELELSYELFHVEHGTLSKQQQAS